MPAPVSVDASDLARVVRSFGDRGRQLDRLMPIVADILVSAVDDVYDAEGPDWEPLAESTLRQRRGSTAKILQDTGVMAGSTRPYYGSDWAEARAGVGYAKYHVSGTKRMPARNPFDLGPFERDVLDDVADLMLKEVAR